MSKTANILDLSLTYSSVDDKDISSLIDLVRKGLKYTLFMSLTRSSPFDMHDWSSFLHISERTMQRYEKENKIFDTVHSEKIIQITLLYKYGSGVFGSKEKFNSWLETPNLALGKTRPKELLDNAFGLELLKDELTRIEHGVLA
jgi:putative toxin-antitoxin system antitoxin component (TIGR02293 family)